MADKNKLIKLVNQYYNNSSDNHCYSVNLQLETFLDSIDYNTYNLEWLEKITPEFQRDMKKWS